MKPELAARAQDLFDQAIELAPGDRDALIDGACDDSDSLRREVASLLAADLQLGGEDDPDGSRSAPPLRVGPYRLVSKIGEGGMSGVFLGVRDDGELERRVAIKLIRPELATPDMVRRFETERQILASLDHPGIARLHDAGRTHHGAPYFVMEHIEGEAIDRYCDHHRLAVAQRLALFREVCLAVHFAHQNLVVHRDLKPSNILVTAHGRPKLLDFGIAKLLNPGLAPRTSEPTVVWERLLTPEYASPEQLLSRPITTASDVYSLGVLLFKLLADRLPLDLSGLTPAEAEQRIATAEPPRPSAALRAAPALAEVATCRGSTPRGLVRLLAGDLDAIVARALRKEPQNRYASAAELAEDLRRHLEGLPVAARRGRWRYRAGRFARRHRLAVGVGTAGALLILSATVALAVLSGRLAEERDVARRERDRAQGIASFLGHVFEQGGADQAQGREVTIREALEQASRRLEVDLADQLERKAELLTTLGEVHYGLALFPRAAELHQAALEARVESLGPDHPAVGQSLVLLGDALRRAGQYPEAESTLRRALARELALPSPDPLAVAASRIELGRLLSEAGRPAEAEPLQREALEARERFLGPGHPLVADALGSLGSSLGRQGRWQEAETLHRRALGLFERSQGRQSIEVAAALNSLASELVGLQRLAEAQQLLEEADRIEVRLLGERHPNRPARLSNLGALASRQKDYAQAAGHFETALGLGREMLPAGHPHLFFMLHGLGLSWTELGRAGDAEPLLREALELRRRAVPTGHWELAWAEVCLGRCLLAQRRFAEAEPLLLGGLAPLREQQAAGANKVRITLEKLVELYRSWGRPEKAAPFEQMLTAKS